MLAARKGWFSVPVSKTLWGIEGRRICATNQGWNSKTFDYRPGTEKNLAGSEANTVKASRHEPWDGPVAQTLVGEGDRLC